MEIFHNVSSVNILRVIIAMSWTFQGAYGFMGINWGRQNSQRLIPSMVVDLLLQNNIRNIKLYSPSNNVLQAFANSGVNISITLPDEALDYNWDASHAMYWLDTYVGKYRSLNININRLLVGNQPLSYLKRKVLLLKAVDAMEVIQVAAINKYNDSLQVTMSHFTDVLKSGLQKPSEAEFRDDIKDKMHKHLVLLNRTGAPFIVDTFPFYYVKQLDWPIEFAFIDNKSGFKVIDGDMVYHNVFEFIYDSFLHAMRKEGFPDMKLTVGQIGWPTDGYDVANPQNAERFHKSLLPYIAQKKGTPLRPGIDIDIFIHSLVDENKNKMLVGPFQRHWGVYMANGEPKYRIDFTGQGRDIYPTTAKGVVPMPRRWCIYNGITTNITKVRYWVNASCSQVADCTALAPNGSCSNLEYAQNVSYAFNMYFQEKAQIDGTRDACDFDGLGRLVLEDPSVGSCKFPVGILSAEIKDTVGNSAISIKFSGSGCNKMILLLSLVLMILFC